MKSFLGITFWATSVWAQTIQFINTSWTGPFTAGEAVSLAWTTGNNLPVSLSIKNATWSSQILVGRAVSPPVYSWTVPSTSGIVSGNYQLTISQVNGGANDSPVFAVVIPNSNTVTMTTSTPAATVTVTYLYWDDQCGCTKTASATTPMNTGLPLVTTRWWDNSCGCHMSAVVPVATILATNNYTVPAAPPAATTPVSTSAMVPSATSGTAKPSMFAGGANRLEISIAGLFVLGALLTAI